MITPITALEKMSTLYAHTSFPLDIHAAFVRLYVSSGQGRSIGQTF